LKPPRLGRGGACAAKKHDVRKLQRRQKFWPRSGLWCDGKGRVSLDDRQGTVLTVPFQRRNFFLLTRILNGPFLRIVQDASQEKVETPFFATVKTVP